METVRTRSPSLSPDQVAKIRKLRKDGYEIDMIAKRFGVDRRRISAACKGLAQEMRA